MSTKPEHCNHRRRHRRAGAGRPPVAAGRQREGLRAGQGVPAHRRRHPDEPERHARAARARARAAAAAAGLPAPRWTARVWDTGEYLSELTFGAEAEKRYGAPYLLMHRGDLHAALFSAVPPELIAYEKKLVGLDRNGAGVTLRFADGEQRRRGRRHRRRRGPLAGARDPARAREAQVHGPGRAPHGVPGVAAAGTSSSIPAPSGGARTGTSSSIP